MSERLKSNLICLILLGISMPFLLLSCSGMKIKNLNDTIEKYNMALRWGGYSAVTPLIEESERETFIGKKMKDMQNKNIVDYGLSNISLDNDGKAATALVQYSFIDQNSQSLNSYGEIQIWKLIKGQWYLSKIIESDKKVPRNTNFSQ